MVFVDYSGQKIELSDEVWVSQKREDTELYYQKKENLASGKVRYCMVAVKKLAAGNFISSAMTKSTIVGSKLIYKKP